MQTPLSAINPEKLDTDRWLRVAESMGAKTHGPSKARGRDRTRRLAIGATHLFYG